MDPTRAIRDFMRPIPDDALPHLQTHKVRALRAVPFVLGFTSIADALVEIPTGRAYPARALGLLSTGIVTYAVTAWLSWRPSGKRYADLLLLALSVQFLTVTSLNAWMRVGGHSELASFAVLIPMLVAMFVPWRPRFSLRLWVATLTAYGLTRAIGAPIEMAPELFVYVSVSVCVASCVASQAQRRLWLKLEQARHQVAAAERMSSLGRMTAGIAHELKTPLAAALNGLDGARGLAEELRESIGHPQVTSADLQEIAVELADSVSVVEVSVRRATQFIHAIRSHTLQMHETHSAPFVVAEAVASAVTLVTHAAKKSDIQIDAGGVDPALTLVGDASKFGQILTNLITNAVDACAKAHEGTRVSVAARRTEAGVTVTVSDDGPGVSVELEERIFEPLFTTKGTADGTGLGLSISRDIARGAFGGTLRLVRQPKGACFELSIPSGDVPASLRTAAWTPSKAA